MTDSAMTSRSKEVRRGREQVQAVPDHAERADLVQYADQQHGGSGLRRGGRVRQPGVERPQRCLDRERDEEAEEQPLLRGRAQRQVRQLAEQERALVAAVGRVDVQGDDRDQHEQAAEQAVQQELDGRVLPLADAEAADHEVHRHQHGLEEDVEEEDVGGGEDADHHGLEHQHHREIGLHAAHACRASGAASGGRGAFLDVIPGREHNDRHQDGGHQDQDERDAVYADRVVHAELRDPLVDLLELEPRAAGLELDGHGDGDGQGR